MTIRTTIKTAAFASLSTLALVSGIANAGYHNCGDHLGIGGHALHEAESFSTIGTAWLPGVNTARAFDGTPMAGGATWSVMAPGISDVGGWDPHGGAATTEFDALYGAGVSATASFGAALDLWASVSGFTNLGMVTDGGGGFGASDADGGGAGDIRVGAVFIDGNVGPNVLAHAYTAGTEEWCLNDAALCGNSPGGSVLGDVHFDDANLWSDGGTGGTIDFFTVAVHELGHALGLGHSDVVGSIMEAIYAGPRRTLHEDDIAGIQALYGPDIMLPPGIPAPGTLLLFLLGAASLLSFRKLRA